MGTSDYSDPRGNGKPPADRRPQFMEIDTGRNRRWIGWFGYLLFYLFVTALLVLLFIKFTGSWRLALALVLFMVGYMAVMGWLAGRQPGRKE